LQRWQHSRCGTSRQCEVCGARYTQDHQEPAAKLFVKKCVRLSLEQRAAFCFVIYVAALVYGLGNPEIGEVELKLPVTSVVLALLFIIPVCKAVMDAL
jgi:hypothetical protein